MHQLCTSALFPDLHHKVAVFPGIAQRCQSGENVLCPSPPLSASRASGDRKLLSFRERRLRPGLSSLGTSLPEIKGVRRFSETFKASEVPDPKQQQVLKLPRINVRHPSLPALVPHPPPTRRYGNKNHFEVKKGSQLRIQRYSMKQIAHLNVNYHVKIGIFNSML